MAQLPSDPCGNELSRPRLLCLRAGAVSNPALGGGEAGRRGEGSGAHSTPLERGSLPRRRPLTSPSSLVLLPVAEPVGDEDWLVSGTRVSHGVPGRAGIGEGRRCRQKGRVSGGFQAFARRTEGVSLPASPRLRSDPSLGVGGLRGLRA